MPDEIILTVNALLKGSKLYPPLSCLDVKFIIAVVTDNTYRNYYAVHILLWLLEYINIFL